MQWCSSPWFFLLLLEEWFYGLCFMKEEDSERDGETEIDKTGRQFLEREGGGGTKRLLFLFLVMFFVFVLFY